MLMLLVASALIAADTAATYPGAGRPAEQQTKVLVWYSPTALHFGFAHTPDRARSDRLRAYFTSTYPYIFQNVKWGKIAQITKYLPGSSNVYCTACGGPKAGAGSMNSRPIGSSK